MKYLLLIIVLFFVTACGSELKEHKQTVKNLKGVNITENKKTWWIYYYDIHTKRCLYSLDYTNCNDNYIKIGYWAKFEENGSYYIVREIIEDQNGNSRRTNIYLERDLK